MSRECMQCNDPFEQIDSELFCCSRCRNKFWESKDPKKSKSVSILERIEDAKYEFKDVMNALKKLKLHMNRMEIDYGDWEDRFTAVEDQLYKLEKEAGVIEEEIIKSPQAQEDALALFGITEE